MTRPKMPKVNKQAPKNQPFSLTVADVQALESVECANCGANLFQEALMLKKLSAFHPGNHTGQPQTLPAKVIICCLCKEEVK